MASATDEESSDTLDYLSFEELVGRFYETEPRVAVQAVFGAATDKGLVRANNEDNYLVSRRRRVRDVLLTSLPRPVLNEREQEAYVLAVADGMGGHQFGELASELALRTGWNLGAGEVKWTVKLNRREEEELKDKARVFFKLIDGELHRRATEQPQLFGMGTTLTICYTTGPGLFVLHAGDSRAYLHREGGLKRLTTDHTRAQEMIEAGIVEEGSPEAMRYKHILTNCLGGPYLSVDVDVEYRRLRHGDVIMLCTDGLTDMVEDEEIGRVLGGGGEPQEMAELLVAKALENGGHDNVTVVVGRYAFPTADETIDLPGPVD